MVPWHVLSRTNLSESSVAASSKSQSLNSLAPLEISCLSFSDPHPLFSIACSLFSENTGGVVPLRHLRILGGVPIARLSIFNSCLFISLQIPFSVTYLFSDSSALPGGGGIPLPIFSK